MAPQLPPGYRRRAYATLASTNGEALKAARQGEAGGLWITARQQSQGRGRRGRPWSTAEGNLAASLLLIDPAPAEVAPTLSFVAAVALHQAVIDLAGPAVAERLELKWPNDLLLDGFKTAGILVEGERRPTGGLAVVVGIGVNCVSHPDPANGHPASDLRSRGILVDVEALVVALASRLAAEIETWSRGAGFAATRSAWLARCTGIGQPIRADLGERVIDGRFETLDAAGRLIVTRADGRREWVSAGDVFLTAAGSPVREPHDG
ncbi:MAG: biotin--[acetyl-CoA-carboxylase] ligase [Bauldia sp.]